MQESMQLDAINNIGSYSHLEFGERINDFGALRVEIWFLSHLNAFCKHNIRNVRV